MAKLTRKYYKRKKVAFAAVLLGGVALISSGFAAWVLSSNANQGNQGGVNVGQLVDGTLSMKVYLAYESGKKVSDTPLENGKKIDDAYFSFDADGKDEDGTPQEGETLIDSEGNARKEKMYWRDEGKDGNNDKPEKLSNTFLVEVKSKINNLSSLKIKLSLGENDSKFKEVVTAKFVSMPGCYSDTEKEIKPADSTGWKAEDSGSFDNDTYSVKSTNDESGYTWTFVYTVTFKWGTRFNGKNPCYFFDSNDKSNGTTTARSGTKGEDSFVIGDGYGDTTGYAVSNTIIREDMNWLEEQINNTTYTIDFTATGK